MSKALFTASGLLVLAISLLGQAKTNAGIWNESQRNLWEAEARQRQLDIEERKVALGERQLYLAKRRLRRSESRKCCRKFRSSFAFRVLASRATRVLSMLAAPSEANTMMF